MDQQSLRYLSAAVYLVAAVLLCRVLGASLARKRFGIRDLLYVTTIVAVTAALVAAADWF